MAVPTESCSGCVFYVEADANTGRCARYAPQAAPPDAQNIRRFQAVWPHVVSTDWCGEWAAYTTGTGAASTSSSTTLSDMNDTLSEIWLLLKTSIED